MKLSTCGGNKDLRANLLAKNGKFFPAEKNGFRNYSEERHVRRIDSQIDVTEG